MLTQAHKDRNTCAELMHKKKSRKEREDFIFLLPIFLLIRNESIWLLKTVKKQHIAHALTLGVLAFFSIIEKKVTFF